MLRVSDQGATFGQDPTSILNKVGISIQPDTVKTITEAGKTAYDIYKATKAKAPAATPTYVMPPQPAMAPTSGGLTTGQIAAIVAGGGALLLLGIFVFTRK